MSETVLQKLNRDNIDEYIVSRLHVGRSVAQANIDLIEVEGRRYVIKDFGGHHPFIQKLWGERIIAREWRVYKRLEGIDGVPRVLLKLDASAFIMEQVNGDRIPHRKESNLTPEFFKRLKRLVGEMHKRGITHGDLRRKNILVGPDSKPHLIDFAGAYCMKMSGFPGIRAAIFRRLKKVDELTILRIQSYMMPDSLTEKELRRLENIPWYLRLGRFFKKKIYRPFKHMMRGKKRR